MERTKVAGVLAGVVRHYDGTVVSWEYGWSWGGGINGREEALRGRNSRIASSLEIVPRERLLLGLTGGGW